MWNIYLLLCDGVIIYTGMTNNLKRRFSQHKNKHSVYTSRFSELKLIYSENFETKIEAVNREKEIKKWSKKRKLALIKQKEKASQPTATES
jgi:putative endonuclease